MRGFLSRGIFSWVRETEGGWDGPNLCRRLPPPWERGEGGGERSVVWGKGERSVVWGKENVSFKPLKKNVVLGMNQVEMKRNGLILDQDEVYGCQEAF